MKLTNMEALNASVALKELGARDDIPIRASLDIAIISNLIDVQTKAYGQVLQNLYKKYSIEAKPQENGGVQFTCTAGTEPKEGKELDKETAKLRRENMEAFGEKLSDLLEANTADMNFKKIKLPDDITIKPEILKSLTEFVEIG